MNGKVLLRVAVPSEQKCLEALQLRASLQYAEYRDALLAHPDAIELPVEQITAGQVVVAERQGVVVGFSAVLPRSDGEAELDGLFVEPTIWKQGVGRLLVEGAAEAARSCGATTLHVIGNPNARGFYIACGFEAIGTADTRFGQGLRMKMRL